MTANDMLLHRHWASPYPLLQREWREQRGTYAERCEVHLRGKSQTSLKIPDGRTLTFVVVQEPRATHEALRSRCKRPFVPSAPLLSYE
jgi:hypothetical protein